MQNRKKRTRVSMSCVLGVATQTRRLLNGHTRVARAVNPSKLSTFWRTTSSRETASCSAEAISGNGRSVARTFMMNFAGASAKPFAKIELLVPTKNSTLVKTFSDQRRTCVHLRRSPTQLPCASWSARSESSPQSGLNLAFLAARHLQWWKTHLQCSRPTRTAAGHSATIAEWVMRFSLRL